MNALAKCLDYSVVSAAYKLTVEKKDGTDSAALFMELKGRSLQGEAKEYYFHLILLLLS